MTRSWFPITAALLCLTLAMGTSALAQQPDPFGGSPDLAPADAPADDAADDHDVEETTDTDAETMPVQAQPLPPIDGFSPPGRTSERIGLSATSHRVHLDQNGNLRGRLSLIDPQSQSLVPAQDLQVYFIQNGRVMERVTPGPGGQFVVEGIAPGVYSIAAQGPPGFTAFSAQVLPFDPSNQTGPTELALNGTLIPVTDLAVLPPMPGAMPPPFPPGGPGGFGGGGFMGGGGSGGGGLGGAGSLIGLAGLAGLAGLIDDDEDDAVRRPVVVSPAAP